ncbi:ATP-binding protein [Lysobacter sp. TAF61]|uniref:hybrid sensor histidine kinase/response regulator n=1 Tax=Lysobacter sp. TAF61 TaxID=3233072 RepID=UPI003F951B8B
MTNAKDHSTLTAWEEGVDDATYRLLVESVRDYAIFLLDEDGYIRSWNKGAERIKGYKAGDIVGRHFSVFYPQDRIDQGWPDHELAEARSKGRFEDEGWRLRKDGSQFWANLVLTRIDHPNGELRGFAKITRDLTDRRRIHALEDEGRRLTTFLAMLGHELRNPLAPIANAVAIMQSESIESESLRFCRDVIGRQVAHMTRLVDDLLDVSRITSGKISLELSVLDLREVLGNAMETIEPEARQRGHVLRIQLADEPVWVCGDRARLLQVFSNLLNNAVKFTPAGGVITASMRHDNAHAEVSVRDNGPGIPVDRLEEVFGLFVQGQAHSAQAPGGLGLGLSLVQQLVALHGGEVSAFSTGEAGKGVEFVVRLSTVTEPAQNAMVESRRAPAQPRHILIVDDNRDAADSLQRLLQQWGYRSSMVFDGRSAMDAIHVTRFDAVILDVGLPDIDGLEVARRLRSELQDPPPFIALTGYGQDSDRQASREAGIGVHLTKPLLEGEIEQALHGLFGADD